MTAACQQCRKRFSPKPTGRPQLYCSKACREAAARRRKRQQPAYFTTGTHEWETPAEVFAEWDARFGFTLDVCATPDNAKCGRYFTKRDDGLAQVWRGVVWMNPPYGREIGRWVAKAYDSARAGVTVVCLVPARTDTAWWQRFTPRGEVTFLAGRVHFNGAGSAPFPSAVVVFRCGFHRDDEDNESDNERTAP